MLSSVRVSRLPSPCSSHPGAPCSGALSVSALRALGLTAREAETLRWAALDCSTSQTADRIGIAARTVEKHHQHLDAKFGVHSGAQAVATAWAAVGVRRPRS